MVREYGEVGGSPVSGETPTFGPTAKSAESPVIENRQYLLKRDDHTFVNNTALSVEITVPENEIWFLSVLTAKNGDSVDRNLTVTTRYYEHGTASIERLASAVTVASGGYGTAPHFIDDSPQTQRQIWLLGGETIRVQWAAGGASAGGAGFLHMKYKRVVW